MQHLGLGSRGLGFRLRFGCTMRDPGWGNDISEYQPRETGASRVTLRLNPKIYYGTLRTEKNSSDSVTGSIGAKSGVAWEQGINMLMSRPE